MSSTYTLEEALEIREGGIQFGKNAAYIDILEMIQNLSSLEYVNKMDKSYEFKSGFLNAVNIIQSKCVKEMKIKWKQTTYY